MTLFLAPFIRSCLTLNLLPPDLGTSWWGSSDLLSGGAAWGNGDWVGFSVSPTLGNHACRRVKTGWEKEVEKDL